MDDFTVALNIDIDSLDDIGFEELALLDNMTEKEADNPDAAFESYLAKNAAFGEW